MAEEQIVNFDEKSESLHYKCPSCGAALTFDPEKQALVCEHCGTEQKIEFDSDVKERSFEELFSAEGWKGDVKVIQCQNCGVREVLQKNQISATCPFCGSASVVEKDEMPGVKPDTVIPFKIDEEVAKKSCIKWLKGRFFSPSAFKKNIKLNGLKGCYVPVWTFDSDCLASYSGRLGRTRTRTVVINGKTTTQTYVEYFYVSGQMDGFYNDIYVSGSSSVNQKFVGKVQPFDINEYVRYDDKFLAGFMANHYDVQPLDAWKNAEQRIRNDFQTRIMNRYGASHVDFLDIKLSHVSKSFKYLMLPLYISAVKYKNKVYNQYTNGQTGKVAGKAPLSWLKIGLVSLLGIAAIVALYLLLM